MILQPKSSPSRQGALSDNLSVMPMASVPAWLRRAIPDAQGLAAKDIEDVVLAAGAAIAALDAMVRRQESWSGAWRQRLALAAAAVTARQAGRVEDESALRDAVLLTRPGDDVGPAGRMLLAWRRLAARSAEDFLTEKNLASVLEDFGHARDDAAIGDLAAELRQLSATGGMAGIPVGAFTAAERYGLGRILGAFIADALLAHRLGWSHTVPLMGADAASGVGTGRTRRGEASIAAIEHEAGLERTKNLLAVQARAALRAIDLSAELGRRAEKLLAVAPKLRAKGANTVVQKLLSGDAMVASDPVAGISDRGLRRLFDRLVELGAVRELSGRPTFRIYGL